MKKFTNLLLATVSTLLLAAGAARAANAVDPMTLAKTAANSGPIMDGPGIPCVGGDGGDTTGQP